MMNSRFVFGFLVFILVVSTLTFAYLSRKPLCFDSSLVTQIDYQSSEKTYKSFQCKQLKHVEFSSFLAEQLPAVTQKLLKIEKILDYFQLRKAAIHITVVDGRAELFRLQNDNIFVSKDIFTSAGQLEKLVLKSWFRDNAKSPLLDFSLFEESITDLLLYAAQGRLLIFDPIHKKQIDLNKNIRWPHVLKSLMGYCQSEWRIAEHYNFCSVTDQQIIDRETFSKTAPLSIRPLISKALISAYKSLSGSEQVAVLKIMTDVIQDGAVIVSSEISGMNEARDLVKAFYRLLSAMDRKSGPWLKLIDSFTSELKNYGFTSFDVDPYLDIMVYVSEPDIFKSVYKHLDSSGTSSAVVYNDLIYFPPDTNGISLAEYKNLKSLRGVLVQCEIPTLPKVLSYADKVQKLLIIKACDKKVEFTLGAYIRDGISGFIQTNLDIPFISLHLPSLKYAYEKSTNKSVLNIYSHFRDNKKISDPAINFVQTYRAYQVNSPIEAVDWFR